MPKTYYYITGTDCAVRKGGSVRTLELFDGPHPSEDEAHTIAKQIVVGGQYTVLPFDTPDRDRARQMHNHNLSLSIGGAAAVANKYRLQPKTQAQIEKDEEKAAWGR